MCVKRPQCITMHVVVATYLYTVINYFRKRILSNSTLCLQPRVSEMRSEQKKKRPPSLVGFFYPGPRHPPLTTGIFAAFSSSRQRRSFPIKSHYCCEKLKGARACFSISRTTRQKPICSAMPQGIHAHK